MRESILRESDSHVNDLNGRPWSPNEDNKIVSNIRIIKWAKLSIAFAETCNGFVMVYQIHEML